MSMPSTSRPSHWTPTLSCRRATCPGGTARCSCATPTATSSTSSCVAAATVGSGRGSEPLLLLRHRNGCVGRNRLGREEAWVIVVVREDLRRDRDLPFEAAQALEDGDQVDDRRPRIHQEAERIRHLAEGVEDLVEDAEGDRAGDDRRTHREVGEELRRVDEGVPRDVEIGVVEVDAEVVALHVSEEVADGDRLRASGIVLAIDELLAECR